MLPTKIKMISHSIVLLSIVSFSYCGILKGITDTGADAVSAVANPVSKTVVGATLKKCDVFKAIFGVTFEHLSEKEPDVSGLTIDLILGGDDKKVFPINIAAKQLLASPDFDARKPTVFFLHGFMSSSESDAPTIVTGSLAKKGGANVLALDSSSLIEYFYLKSSTCVQFIGEALGATIVELVEGGVSPDTLHIVGHSLGSHIAGFAGKRFHNETKLQLDRITGLDPAGPCFFQERPDLRLKESDARFVDVIHSDAGILGLEDPIGDVDFYPNAGEGQPGCAIPTCSHSRSWRMFNESVLNERAFPASKCSGWDTFKSGGCETNAKAYMGYGVDRKARGSYYLKTESVYPYGFGDHSADDAALKKMEEEKKSKEKDSKDEKKGSKLLGIF